MNTSVSMFINHNKNISTGLSGNYKIYGGARQIAEIDDLNQTSHV